VNFEVAVCLPRDAETVALLRRVVTDALDAFGVVPDCTDDIRLALSEACSNVIEHAEDDDEYEVRVEVDEHRCALRVRQSGDGFDMSALAEVMPAPDSQRGRGIAMMRALMDRVEFRIDADQTTVLLVKALEFDPDGPLARLRRDNAQQ
jgi:serine/threonine-protein kinase RsbW